MKSFTNTVISFSAAIMLFAAGMPGIAFADGDPSEVKPAPAMTPLDRALDEIQNKEPPIEVAKPPVPAEMQAAPAEEPVVTETAPQPPPAETQAVTEPPPPAPLSRIVEVQPNSSFFGLSVGMYAPFSDRAKGASFGIEWQPGVKIVGFLQPLFGAFVTTRGAAMGYGGLGVPFHLGKRIVVMPSFSVGSYAHGDGRDLGQALTYRAGGEIAYEFDDKSRIGLNAHIISNGKSTSKRDNTAILGLVYTTPIDIFSGKPKPADLAADRTFRKSALSSEK